MTSEGSQDETPQDVCQLEGCTEDRIPGAHYCSAEHESRAASRGTRVTGPTAGVYGDA